MYPTGCIPPKFYGLPKIHKPDTPLRPIVSSCGSVTYGVAKKLAKILKPLVGKPPHHINSTQVFVEQVKHITLGPGECLCSYDVSALLTSVPIDHALNIIKDLLEKDNTPMERTVLAVNDIILLLEFCLKNTYFSFQDQFYEQVEGAAMGSPVSPIVANLYMEYLEPKALSTAPHSPRLWCRFVDDTFVIHKEVNKQDFLQHINSLDPAMKFTVEDNKEDGSIPFLDTIVKPEADGSLSITVYRKPTHTDQYLQWDSHHHLSAKFSIIHTLSHRAQIVAASLSCSKKRTTSGRLSPNVYILNGLWTRWRKDLTDPPERSLMGLIAKALHVPKLSTENLKLRATLSYPTHKVIVKVSKNSVVDMAFKPTSKMAVPSKTSWSPLRTKTLWSTKVVPYIGTNVVT